MDSGHHSTANATNSTHGLDGSRKMFSAPYHRMTEREANIENLNAPLCLPTYIATGHSVTGKHAYKAQGYEVSSILDAIKNIIVNSAPATENFL